ncbi:MAG TPA: hypothetical protein VFZ98_12890, partial [Vicinamibacterales bacterium]
MTNKRLSFMAAVYCGSDPAKCSRARIAFERQSTRNSSNFSMASRRIGGALFASARVMFHLDS